MNPATPTRLPAAAPQAAAATAAPDPRLDRFLRDIVGGIESWAGALVSQAAAALESSSQRQAVAGDRQHTASVLALLRAGTPGLRRQIVLGLVDAVHESRRAAPQPAPAEEAEPGGLRLIDEAQIDEDIEVGRLVQIIDSGAEAELRHLAALCSGLRRLDAVDAAAVPLRPLAVARAVRTAVLALAPEAGTRTLLLRILGEVAGEQMRAVYATWADQLERWGVAAAPLRLKLTDGSERLGAGTPAVAAPTAAASAGEPPALMQSLNRLVHHVRALSQASHLHGSPPIPDDDAPLSLRLVEQPRPVGATPAPLDGAAAGQLMDQLFAHLEQQLQGSARSRRMLHALRQPGRALAADEPQVWHRLDHPLWQLLDQLIQTSRDGDAPDAAEVAAPDAVHTALDDAVQRLASAPAPDSAVWQRANDHVRAASERLLSERAQALAPSAEPLRHQVDDEETQFALRRQLVQQLRSTPVCAELRQFLLGPWTQVMAAAALRHGAESPRLAQLAMTVDDLIQALSRPGKAVSSAQRAVLLRQVQQGMAEAGIAEGRTTATVEDLRLVLRHPPAHEDAEAQPPADEPAAGTDAPPAADAPPSSWVLDLNAALPTVPLDMLAAEAGEGRAPVSRQQAWFDALAPGRHCRIFLLGRWMTVQLTWVSDKRNLFLFTSRHGGRTHSLSRRMLEKLLEAGLAAIIEPGLLLAQAMDSMIDTGMASR